MSLVRGKPVEILGKCRGFYTDGGIFRKIAKNGFEVYCGFRYDFHEILASVGKSAYHAGNVVFDIADQGLGPNAFERKTPEMEIPDILAELVEKAREVRRLPDGHLTFRVRKIFSVVRIARTEEEIENHILPALDESFDPGFQRIGFEGIFWAFSGGSNDNEWFHVYYSIIQVKHLEDEDARKPICVRQFGE